MAEVAFYRKHRMGRHGWLCSRDRWAERGCLVVFVVPSCSLNVFFLCAISAQAYSLFIEILESDECDGNLQRRSISFIGIYIDDGC